MFIKLTKLDNSAIWFNASYIVTVEPRRGGGTIVVPIGDGLDYEVREPAETVLSMLEGAPAPAIVPVTSHDSAVKPKAAASPMVIEQPMPPKSAEPEAPKPAAVETPPPAAEPEAPVKKVRKTRKTAAKSEADGEEKPAKTTKKRATKKSTKAKKAEEAPEEAKSEEPVAAEPPPVEMSPVIVEAPMMPLTPDQVSRVCRMMPGSLKKLANTLVSQFKIVDVDLAIHSMEALGLFSVDANGSRIHWLRTGI